MKKRLLATIPVLLVVFLCSSFPVFAIGSTASSDTFTGYQYLDSNNEILAAYTITSFKPYPIDVFYHSGANVNGFEFEALVKLELNNLSNKNIKIVCDGTNRIPLFISTVSMADGGAMPWQFQGVEFIGGHLVPSEVGDSSSYVYLEPYNGDVYLDSNTSLIVPKNTKLVTYFKVKFWGIVANYSTLVTPSFDASTVFIRRNSTYQFSYVNDVELNDYNYIPEIYDKLVEILQHYNANVPQSQTVTNESSALETQSDAVHNQESSYYTQTNTALSNTGLSNFSFSQNVIGGLGKAKDQFTYVWNKLGDYKDVYLFSMTLAIALMIIRHVRPIRRKKEE